MHICERLKEERERLGFTQDAFGAIGGVSRRAQANYESGERSPDSSYLAAIAKINADIQYIVTGVRVANRLEPTEQLFLERFRGAPKAIQDEALLTLMGQQGQPSSAKQIFHGSVSQSIEGGAVFNKGVKFDLGDKK